MTLAFPSPLVTPELVSQGHTSREAHRPAANTVLLHVICRKSPPSSFRAALGVFSRWHCPAELSQMCPCPHFPPCMASSALPKVYPGPWSLRDTGRGIRQKNTKPIQAGKNILSWESHLPCSSIQASSQGRWAGRDAGGGQWLTEPGDKPLSRRWW